MRTWLRWTLLAAFAVFLAPLSTTSALADDPVTCASIMPVRPTLVRLNEAVVDANCVLLDDFHVDASHYQTAQLAGSRVRDGDAQVAAVREAVERSAAYYGRWFHTADTTIIIGELRARDEAGEATTDFRGGCVISIEAAAHHTGRTFDRNELMRTVAHELFHCVQFTDPSLHHYQVKWRDEGTAEYFASLVIPDAAFNAAYGENLSQIISQPLYTLDESAAPFIFYLGQIRGPEAVANMLQGAYRNETATGSVITLNHIPDVDTLFHDFIRAWIDGRLYDPNGRLISLSVPDFPAPIRINRDQTIDLGDAPPFQVSFQTYDFASGVDWIIEAPEDEPVRGSWRRAEDSWLPLPATVESCERTGGGLLILTATQSPRVDPAEVRPRQTRVRQSPDRRVCQCPLGSWTIPYEDLQHSTYEGAFPEARMSSGSVTVTFNPDGTMRAQLHDITYDAAIDRYSGIHATLQGEIMWRWEALPWDERLAGSPAPREPHLMIRRTVVSNGVHWRTRFTARGRVVSDTESPRRGGDEGSVNIATVICRGPRMTIEPTVATTAIRAPPPWYGTFIRNTGG